MVSQTPNWSLIWLGVGFLVLGGILYLIRLWWDNRTKSDVEAPSAFEEFIKAIIEAIKAGRLDTVALLLGALILIVGVMGIDPFIGGGNETPTPSPTAISSPAA